jgi:hypothetical protein
VTSVVEVSVRVGTLEVEVNVTPAGWVPPLRIVDGEVNAMVPSMFAWVKMFDAYPPVRVTLDKGRP